MNQKLNQIPIILLLVLLSLNVSSQQVNKSEWLETALKQSEYQLLAATKKFKDTRKNPRSFTNGSIKFNSYEDWTSGFFPGSLWYMYEITKKEKFKTEAKRFTELLDSAQYRKDTHDLGFILNCSYGNGYRITGNTAYKNVLINGAKSLITRFHPEVGLIKSWDNRKNKEYPVIIDNLMNLELLFEISKITGDSSMRAKGIMHTDKTLANHFRSDNSCFHVVDYDSITGNVIKKETHQGYSNNSSWARGQAWALYGYTMIYRETKVLKYLDQAKKIAAFILNHPNLPKDKIPYWDFDAPNIPDEPRDASSAAIIASALIELSTYTNRDTIYMKTAESILKSLSTPEYLADKGENGLFILKHSTGNWPKKLEIDAPLSYADYYFIEALVRYMKYKEIGIFHNSEKKVE